MIILIVSLRFMMMLEGRMYYHTSPNYPTRHRACINYQQVHVFSGRVPHSANSLDTFLSQHCMPKCRQSFLHSKKVMVIIVTLVVVNNETIVCVFITTHRNNNGWHLNLYSIDVCQQNDHDCD